jgi:hypothetical protein
VNEEDNVTEKRLAKLEEGVAVLAAEVVRLTEVQVATGKLTRRMDERVKLITALADYLYAALEKRGLVSSRPKGGHPIVN